MSDHSAVEEMNQVLVNYEVDNRHPGQGFIISGGSFGRGHIVKYGTSELISTAFNSSTWDKLLLQKIIYQSFHSYLF